MLNCKDVSEYLKISADGVEVSTSASFVCSAKLVIFPVQLFKILRTCFVLWVFFGKKS